MKRKFTVSYLIYNITGYNIQGQGTTAIIIQITQTYVNVDSYIRVIYGLNWICNSCE